MFIFMIIWKNELLEIFPFSKYFLKLKIHILQKMHFYKKYGTRLDLWESF